MDPHKSLGFYLTDGVSKNGSSGLRQLRPQPVPLLVSSVKERPWPHFAKGCQKPLVGSSSKSLSMGETHRTGRASLRPLGKGWWLQWKAIAGIRFLNVQRT